MNKHERELGDINRHTSGLANDVEQLIKKLDDPNKKDDLKRELSILKGKLEGVAGNYEPDPEAPDPTDPNVTGKSREELKSGKDDNKDEKDGPDSAGWKNHEQSEKKPQHPYDRTQDPNNPLNRPKQSPFDNKPENEQDKDSPFNT